MHHRLPFLLWPKTVATLLQCNVHFWLRGQGGMMVIHLSPFLEHDYTATLELVDHPPEVSHCVLQWTLGSYVSTSLLIALTPDNKHMCHGVGTKYVAALFLR